jgi:hypothetical protein
VDCVEHPSYLSNDSTSADAVSQWTQASRSNFGIPTKGSV